MELTRFRGYFSACGERVYHAKNTRVYPPDVRQKILELIRSGRSGNAVAAQFNVSRQTISNWLKQDALDAGRRTDGLTSDERARAHAVTTRRQAIED